MSIWRAASVAATAVAAALVAIAASGLATPTYRAEARLELADGMASVPRADTSVNVQQDGRLLRIRASSSNPVVARDTANSYAQTVLGADGGAVSVLAWASAPVSPASPQTSVYAAAGGVLGASTAAAFHSGRLAAQRHRRRTRVLATLPSTTGIEGPDADLAHRLRELGKALELGRRQGTGRRVLVTSVGDGDAARTVTSQVAWVNAAAGLLTVVVNGSIGGRRPTSAQQAVVPLTRPRTRGSIAPRLAPAAGGPVQLTTTVAREHIIKHLIPTSSPDVYVLTALPGAGDPEPATMLRSSVVSAVIDQLAAAVDAVIIEAAPLSPEHRAALARLADTTVVAADCGRRSRRQLERATAGMARAGIEAGGVLVDTRSGRQLG